MKVLLIFIMFLPSITMSNETTEEKIKAVEFLKKVNFGIGINSGLTAGLDKLGEELKNGLYYPIGCYIQGDTLLIPDTRLEFNLNYIQLFGRNSDDVKMLLYPITLSLLWELPFSLGIDTYVKAGGGFIYEVIITQKRDKYLNKYLGEEVTENNAPLFVFGLGSSFNITDWLTLKSEIVYNFVYEKYIPEALDNGHLIYFNIGIAYQMK